MHPGFIKVLNCYVRRFLEGGAYFKVREMNNIQCQNLVIFSFKIRMKHKFSLIETILISTAFRGAELIIEETLI